MIDRRKNNEDRRSDVRTALAHYRELAAQAEAMAGKDRRIAELTEALKSAAYGVNITRACLMDSVVTHGTHGGWLHTEALRLDSELDLIRAALAKGGGRMTTLDDIRAAIRNVQICPDQVEGLLNTISGSLVGGCEPLSELIDNTADAAGELYDAWAEAHADEWAADAYQERLVDERIDDEALGQEAE